MGYTCHPTLIDTSIDDAYPWLYLSPHMRNKIVQPSSEGVLDR